MKKKDGKQKAPEGKYMSSVKVGPKGQIVIPKEAREMFGIAGGYPSAPGGRKAGNRHPPHGFLHPHGGSHFPPRKGRLGLQRRGKILCRSGDAGSGGKR